jgi:hypothetical protein
VWLWVHFGPATTGVVRARGGMGVRRCPTLPHGPPCSTIGAVRLSFRVRNVSGRFPHAMAAVTASICSIVHSLGRSPGAGWSCSRSWIENRMVDANSVQDGHTRVGCVVLSSSRTISTGQLHPSRGFHVRPINPVVCWGPLAPKGWEISSRGRLPA